MVRKYLLTTAVTGAILAVVSLYGLSIFSEADWFTDPGPYAQNWTGYDKVQFAGLSLFTFLSPLSFTLLFTTLQQFIRISAEVDRRQVWTANLVGAFFLLGICGVGLWGSYSLLQCMGVGCVGPRWKPFEPPRAEAGLGWQACVGCAAFFSSFLFLTARLITFTQVLHIFNRIYMYASMNV
jgi:hypothetical protein